MAIVGNWSKFPLKNPNKWFPKIFTLLNFEDHEISESKLNIWNIDQTTRFKTYPTEYFIIAEIDVSSLRMALDALKKSVWWNVYGFFMIQKIHLNSCSEAYDYLKVAWSFNILSVIFICMDSNLKFLSFTFNPYNDRAPMIWTEHILQSNGHQLVLFKYYHADFDGRFCTSCYITI